MKSLFVKGSLVLALAAVFGMPNASAAPLVAVEPTLLQLLMETMQQL